MRIKPWMIALAALSLSVTFQNCGQNLGVNQDPDIDVFKEAAACMDSSAEACIFNKNAVNQSGKAMTQDRVGGYQVYGASVVGRGPSGNLQNSDFSILTLYTSRVNPQNGFKYYYAAGRSDLEQVMAYIELDRARQWMNGLGIYPARNMSLSVYADSDFNGYVPGKAQLHLERNGYSIPAALDGGVVNHLYAQANIYAATGGTSHANLATSAWTCIDYRGYTSPNGCCKTDVGCGPALIDGAADAFVAMLYGPGSTGVGEGWRNSPGGSTICGLVRDPAQQSSLKLSKAVTACSSRGVRNQIQVIGLVYASIWYRVWEKTSDKPGLEKLFLSHLALIRGEDDFITMKSKILSLDLSMTNGKFSSLLNQEFTNRGL